MICALGRIQYDWNRWHLLSENSSLLPEHQLFLSRPSLPITLNWLFSCRLMIRYDMNWWPNSSLHIRYSQGKIFKFVEEPEWDPCQEYQRKGPRPIGFRSYSFLCREICLSSGLWQGREEKFSLLVSIELCFLDCQSSDFKKLILSS